MRMILAFIVVSSVTLSLVATGIIGLTTPQPIASYEPLNSAFMPDKPRPQNSYCEWYYYGNIISSCYIHQTTDVVISFSYNRSTGLITHSALRPPTYQTLGKLMLAWGRPSGYVADTWGVTIYWEKRAAFVFDRAIGPFSRVWYLEYFDEPQKFRPWRGFRSMERLRKQR